jgi:hypothetical protein
MGQSYELSIRFTRNFFRAQDTTGINAEMKTRRVHFSEAFDVTS